MLWLSTRGLYARWTTGRVRRTDFGTFPTTREASERTIESTGALSIDRVFWVATSED